MLVGRDIDQIKHEDMKVFRWIVFVMMYKKKCRERIIISEFRFKFFIFYLKI